MDWQTDPGRGDIITGQDLFTSRGCAVCHAIKPGDRGGCFFSSRRRHTRYWRDWSSDVCSSDLGPGGMLGTHGHHEGKGRDGGDKGEVLDRVVGQRFAQRGRHGVRTREHDQAVAVRHRSEEHTSELQSRQYLVCRLLLEKKKKES